MGNGIDKSYLRRDTDFGVGGYWFAAQVEVKRLGKVLEYDLPQGQDVHCDGGEQWHRPGDRQGTGSSKGARDLSLPEHR